MKLLKISILLIFGLNIFCNYEKKSQNITHTNKIIDKVENKSIEKPKFVKSIPVPSGYERINIKKNSFGEYLRNLPLKQGDNIVYLFNGQKKGYQGSQYAIVDIDVGKRDLQQCADAVMRLRGEYLYSHKRYSEIHFNFLGDGKPRYYKNYAKGNYSKKKFRKYMDYIFAYANTASLRREMKSNNDINNIMLGDVFIQIGRPYGHAVTVMDVAINPTTNKKIFLLSQSYMPAQDIHILINPNDNVLSPWYSTDFDNTFQTPEWTFNKKDLKRF